MNTIKFSRYGKAFTLIELLVVLVIIAVLLTLVSPRYHSSVQRSKEAVLRQNLHTLRDVIDKYYEDTGRYPAKLSELVEKNYIRQIPIDPLTESADTWRIVGDTGDKSTMVYDVHSGAEGTGKNGIPFHEW